MRARQGLSRVLIGLWRTPDCIESPDKPYKEENRKTGPDKPSFKQELREIVMGPIGEGRNGVLAFFNCGINRNERTQARSERQGFEGGLKCGHV